MSREPDWRGLGKELDGRVSLPGDVGYLENSSSFNRRYDGARPAAVVSVGSVADVQRSIVWARDGGVPLVVRSGGHSYGGFSVSAGLVLDLSPLNAVTVDGSTGLVTVAGGANSGQVHQAVRPYEMSFPLSNAPGVGVGGLVLGGGMAALSRKLGLTCDVLTETAVVTADGRLLTCNARENADLFWACRGGGGGNFGVNVSFTFQAAPVPNVSTFRLLWRWPDGAKVLAVMHELLLAAPERFAMRLGASTFGADRTAVAGNCVVSAAGQYLGGAGELSALLDPVLTVAPPARQEIIEQTFWAARNYLVHDTSADRFAVHTRFGRARMPAECLATILDQVARWPGSTNADGGGIGLFQWGGAINRPAPDDTAFVHRDTAFLASMDTSWTVDDSPACVTANLDWLADFHARMAAYLSDSAYQNFIDPDLECWRSAYYGVNFDRLLAVKQKYDPDGVFQFAQSIRT